MGSGGAAPSNRGPLSLGPNAGTAYPRSLRATAGGITRRHRTILARAPHYTAARTLSTTPRLPTRRYAAACAAGSSAPPAAGQDGEDRGAPDFRQRPITSRSTAWAALWPGAPVTSPPGCVPEPHRYRPAIGVR